MRNYSYISVCSGIEAATVAWEPLGFKALAFAEVDKFPSTVLAHHWPLVPNVSDMLSIPELLRTGLLPAPDILVGGTPCQSYSVAGKRLGLEDPRGRLTLAYVEILNTIDLIRGSGDECVCVWENVPGVLSDSGNAFGEFLAKLAGESGALQPSGGKWPNAGCVFGPQRSIAWRVLDAQYFGVAQRRRRVFLVASARKGFDPTQILFESDGVRRDTAPSREAWQDVAGTLTSSLGKRNGTPDCGSTTGQLVCRAHGQANAEMLDEQCPALTCNHEAPILFRTSVQVCPTLNAGGNTTGGHRPPGSTVDTADSLIVVHGTQDPCVSYGIRTANTSSNGWGIQTELTHALDCAQGLAVSRGSEVRRLMPLECARLQGFPDTHCQIPYRNKAASECPDGPQYKAYGNSMAVPCMNWLGKRLLTGW